MMRDPALGLLAASLLMTTSTGADELRRRADWGFRMVSDSACATVRGVQTGSAADDAGLRDGDCVVRINDVALDTQGAIRAVRRRFRGGDRVRLHVVRDGQTRNVDLTLAPLPRERIPGCEVRYGSIVTSRGDRVRTVLTRPAGSKGRLPTIVFVPWLW